MKESDNTGATFPRAQVSKAETNECAANALRGSIDDASSNTHNRSRQIASGLKLRGDVPVIDSLCAALERRQTSLRQVRADQSCWGVPGVV